MPLPVFVIPAAIAAAAGTTGFVVYKKRKKAKEDKGTMVEANVYQTPPPAPGPKGMSPALKKAFDDAMAAPIASLTKAEWGELANQFDKLGFVDESRALAEKAAQASEKKPMPEALQKLYMDAMDKPAEMMLQKDWYDLSEKLAGLGYTEEARWLRKKGSVAPITTPLPAKLQTVYDFGMSNKGKGYWFLINLSQLFSNLGYAEESKNLGMKAHTDPTKNEYVPGKILLSWAAKSIGGADPVKYNPQQYEDLAVKWEQKKYYSLASMLRLRVIDQSVKIPFPVNTSDNDAPITQIPNPPISGVDSVNIT